MSGIAGIINFNGEPVDRSQLLGMTAGMKHRGPDGIDHWSDDSVALGQCMLCTTPESLEEKQPLSNEDGTLVLVMDGRVDNWESLRSILKKKGIVLRDNSDAELVLRCYEVWKNDCLARIDGDFAFVIWDSVREVAFCARDRVGNKPFFYNWNGRTLAFSSEPHTILSLPWVDEKLNQGMLTEFLAWEWHSRHETLWVGLNRLEVAHFMEVSSRGSKSSRYWSPNLWVSLPYTKEEDFFEHYRELFGDIVRRMSRSHQELAFEVSGGLDSSAIFCLADHLRGAGKLLAPGIQGYTLAFTEKGDANELEYVHAIADYLGVAIEEVPPSKLPLQWYLQRARESRCFPGFPNGVMALGILERASRSSSVLFTGLGGDEWLAGSRTYYAEELAQGQWLRFLECMASDIGAFGALETLRLVARFGAFPLMPHQLQGALRTMFGKHQKNDRRSRYWLSSQSRELLEARSRESGRPRFKSPRRGQLSLLDYLDDAYDDHCMQFIDSLSAPLGLEERHPYRSHKIIEYAFSLPERLRLRGDQSKYVHVQALREYLPPKVFARKTKAEFSSIFTSHLDQMEEVFASGFPEHLILSVCPEGLARLYMDNQKATQSGWRHWVLWSVFGCYGIS